MYRTVCLAAGAGTIARDPLRRAVDALVLAGSAALHVRYLPFRRGDENVLEAAGAISCLVFSLSLHVLDLKSTHAAWSFWLVAVLGAFTGLAVVCGARDRAAQQAAKRAISTVLARTDEDHRAFDEADRLVLKLCRFRYRGHDFLQESLKKLYRQYEASAKRGEAAPGPGRGLGLGRDARPAQLMNQLTTFFDADADVDGDGDAWVAETLQRLQNVTDVVDSAGAAEPGGPRSPKGGQAPPRGHRDDARRRPTDARGDGDGDEPCTPPASNVESLRRGPSAIAKDTETFQLLDGASRALEAGPQTRGCCDGPCDSESKERSLASGKTPSPYLDLERETSASREAWRGHLLRAVGRSREPSTL